METPTDVRCRFAPSPTGYLHVGGARTALFNFLLARRYGGKFLVRIEDTDQTRNIAGAETKLLEDLRWLGLTWDEGPEVGGPCGPYHQSSRIETYREHARRLIDAGLAYYATESDVELNSMREAARARKENFRYPRPKHFPTHAEADEARAAGRPVVVRLRVPAADVTVHDRILGDVHIRGSELDDFVLLKSDGWPTYHFAVVVDDELMKITHVLRGQEHLMNTPRHIVLQRALGYRTPEYAHLPIILNMDGSKMSKREKDKAVRAAAAAAVASGRTDEPSVRRASGADDATFTAWQAGETQLDGEGLRRLANELGVSLPEIQIHDFRASGYLPEVIVNFIALLGWSPGDDREKMTLAEMTRAFSIDRVGKTNARFDRAKLLNFNTTAVAAASTERRLAALRDQLAASDGASPLSRQDDATLSRLLDMCDGVRVMDDLHRKSWTLFVDDGAYPFDAEAVKKILVKGDPNGLTVIRELREPLAALPEWTTAALDALVRGFAESRALGLGKVAQPLRVAVTGTTVSPPIFDTLSLLGRDRTLRRLDRALREAAAGAS